MSLSPKIENGSKKSPISPLTNGKVSVGIGKVSACIGKVSAGIGKVSAGIGKVSAGIGKVSAGYRRVSAGTGGYRLLKYFTGAVGPRLMPPKGANKASLTKQENSQFI